MAKLKIRGKDLIKLGYPEGRAIGMAVNMMLKHFKRSSLKDVLEILKKILEHPDLYLDDDVLGRIAAELIEKPESENQEIPLSDESITYKIYGAQGIEPGASKQMDTAMRLPVRQSAVQAP